MILYQKLINNNNINKSKVYKYYRESKLKFGHIFANYLDKKRERRESVETRLWSGNKIEVNKKENRIAMKWL